MSLGRKTTKYAASAAVLAIAVILGSALYTGVLPAALQVPGSASNQQQQGTQSGQVSVPASTQSTLIVQLTDPPTVPRGTTSLNLTYSAINLLVQEPANGGPGALQTVTATPQGGSATLDLFRLQNVSQTIASANLPNGTTIYSVSFAVTGISVDINGTVSPVTLATGASTFQVTLAKSSVLNGTTAFLVELDPTVVDTPTGYQMVPSAVGILRAHSELGDKDNQVGSKQPITTKDKDDLDQAKGKVTATLLALSVSGNATTLTVRVNNAGDSPFKIVGVGLHGNFTREGPGCGATTTTTSTITTTTSSGHGQKGPPPNGNYPCRGMGGVIFVPQMGQLTTTSTTTTSTTTVPKTCSAGHMAPVNGDQKPDGRGDGNVLAPGQCVDLTFAGPISFGESSITIVPLTTAGQTYIVGVLASDSSVMMSCTLPITATSCIEVTHP
jgi:hypothetical protein